MTLRTGSPPLPRYPAPARAPCRGRDVFLVDLDAFPVDIERRRDPSLRGRAVIIGPRPGDRGVVTCASAEARALGIHAGMPLARAAALAPRDAAFLPGDARAYAEAAAAVHDRLRGFTPQVEVVSIDEVYLDMSGLERHHRSWLAAAGAIRNTVRDETGIAVAVGIGATRAVARIAASLARPDGALEVRRGEERAFLAALPLEVLPGVGPRLRRRLARFNLHAIGDLAAIPEEVLAETFGAGGVVLSRRARGLEAAEDEPPIGRARPRARTIAREAAFPRDTDDPAWIDGMFAWLAQRATMALRREGLAARAVGVRLRYADFRTVEARRRLGRPSDHDEAILGVIRTLWRQRYQRRVKLRRVGVVLQDVVEVHDRQLDLPFSAAVTGRLDRAVDVVRDRHGFGALVRGSALGMPGLSGVPGHRPGLRADAPRPLSARAG